MKSIHPSTEVLLEGVHARLSSCYCTQKLGAQRSRDGGLVQVLLQSLSPPTKPVARRANVAGFAKCLFYTSSRDRKYVQPAMAVAFLIVNLQLSSRSPRIQRIRHVCSVRTCMRYLPDLMHLDGQTVFSYDPPTALSPTVSHFIPSKLNPLSYVFSLAKTFQPTNHVNSSSPSGRIPQFAIVLGGRGRVQRRRRRHPYCCLVGLDFSPR